MYASINKIRLSAVFVGALVLVVSLANVAHAETVVPTRTVHTRVEARDVDIYHVAFVGGAPASVTVVGDGDTDLDVYVYDDDGDLVASDADFTDTCIATWRPWRTGVFTIRVVNNGYVFNRYLISVN